MRDKRILPILLIIVLGVSVTIGSYLMMQNKNSNKEMKQIIVVARNILPYEKIKPDDIKYVDVPMNYNTERIYTEKEEVVGSVLKTSLSSDDKILKEYISSTNVDNMEFITLKTDYTRTGGAKIGDIADVYKVHAADHETQSNTNVKLVAEDVVIVDITNNEGTRIDKEHNSSGVPLGSNIPVQAVKIAIDINKVDVKKLVEGSVNANNGYVFVVKGN